MNELREWLGDTFYKEVTETEVKEGYESVYQYVGGSYTLVELPYEYTCTVTKMVPDYQSMAAVVFVVLTFVSVVTMLRKVFIR